MKNFISYMVLLSAIVLSQPTAVSAQSVVTTERVTATLLTVTAKCRSR